MRASTLPLGIDIGTLRTRVALLELDAAQQPRLVAVATRPSGDDPARAVAEAVAELPTRERRCVLSLGAGDATLRTATFPPLARRERDRAARFEAGRTLGYPIADAAVRVVGVDAARCIIGVAKRSALDARVAAARRARLRPLGVDDAGFALCRAFPTADAIVDVGELATRLVLRDEPIPTVRSFPVGGRAFTAAAAEALGIDTVAAEERKRTLGLAGAGERVRDALVEQLATAIVEARAASRTEVRLVALAGNGSRLQALPRRWSAPSRSRSARPRCRRMLRPFHRTSCVPARPTGRSHTASPCGRSPHDALQLRLVALRANHRRRAARPSRARPRVARGAVRRAPLRCGHRRDATVAPARDRKRRCGALGTTRGAARPAQRTARDRSRRPPDDGVLAADRAVRRSGTVRANEVAAIGNALPPDAWLTGMRFDPASIAIEGHGARMRAIAETLDALARVHGVTAARLVSARRDAMRSDVIYAIALERRP